MLMHYDMLSNCLVKREGTTDLRDTTVWIDLFNPTKAEENLVEQSLGFAIPTREEMNEIEASSRLYQENGAHFMTATIMYHIDTAEPVSTPITFVLSGHRLVTVRYADPKAIAIFLGRAKKGDAACSAGNAVMLGLLEAIVDRSSDLVERLQLEVDKVAHQIFDIKGGQQTRTRRLDVALKQIGREGELVSRVRESLHSMNRLLTYFAQVTHDRSDDKTILARINTEMRDVTSLAEHVNYLTMRITFILDATLGMISIEQNQIIKLFSVAAVVLMPPTLVASVYGMNFKHMPELEWMLGYPLALLLMLAAAVLPLLYFRRKGWL